MKVEATRKKLIVTKAEQKTIQDLYKILNEDKYIDSYGVWDILGDINIGDDSVAKDYGYEIEIVD